MVAVGKMNKAQLIARVQELEAWKETAIKDVLDQREEFSEVIKNLKEENKKLEEEKQTDLDIIENYFANENLRETTWKEWNNMEEEVKKLGEKDHQEYSVRRDADIKEVCGVEDFFEFEEKWQELQAKELARDEEIIDLEQRNKHAIFRHNEMVKEMDSWKQKFLDAGTQLRDANFKIEVLEEYSFDGGVDSFRDFVDNTNGFIEEDENHILEGFHWEIVQDAETNEPHLGLIKNKVSQIQKWEELQESGDADPEYLINAIAEKYGLKPIEWGKPGCYNESAELWDKIMDEAEDR